MNNTNIPFCSIIVLNYFGEEVIDDTLNSLLNLKYPKNKYEIIVVDNNSEDNSKEILIEYLKRYPNIRVFFQNKNLGFSKGNNVGMKKAKGEFVVLLNNDGVVEKNWLKELVKTAKQDEKIFAVSSKILLYPRFINIKFTINPKLLPVYSWISKSNLYDKRDTKLYYLPMRNEFGYFQIEVPYEPYKDKMVELIILCNSRGHKFDNILDFKNAITFKNSSVDVTNIVSDGDDIEYQITINLSHPSIEKESLDKIQNAGIMVFQDGYGRDIGAIVSANKQYYEYDLKQYDKEKEVYASCGAAVLYRRKILKQIGFLDETFFMYYEDVEICERARFAGYKSFYNPRAVIRHHHALFSKEWSPFFIYHVEKGRLLHVYYNFPFRIFLLNYWRFLIDSIINFLVVIFGFRIFLYRLKSKKSETGEPNFIRRIQMVRALFFFIIFWPILMVRKFKYSHLRKKEAVAQNYLRLVKGDWYFS